MSDPSKKKLTAFRLEEYLRELADEMILVRAIKNKHRPETFSDLIRNLIKEEWKRNKDYLNQLNEVKDNKNDKDDK